MVCDVSRWYDARMMRQEKRHLATRDRTLTGSNTGTEITEANDYRIMRETKNDAESHNGDNDSVRPLEIKNEM